MRIPSMSRSLVVAAALSAAALPALMPAPTYAADVAGPATLARNTLRAKDPVGSRCFPVPSSPGSTRWK